MNTALNGADAGSVVQIYATGQGSTTPAVADGEPPPSAELARSDLQPTVFFGTEAAEVLYSGLVPGVPGLWQINARVPANVSGELPVFAILGSIPSNAVTIHVK